MHSSACLRCSTTLKKGLDQIDLNLLISLVGMTSFELTLLEFHAVGFKIKFISGCYAEGGARKKAKDDVFDKFYPVLT